SHRRRGLRLRLSRQHNRRRGERHRQLVFDLGRITQLDLRHGQLSHMERLMTPQDLQTYARQQYNSVGDDFFSDEELYRHIWTAQTRLAKEAFCIERTYETTT